MLPVASRHHYLVGDDQVMLAFDGGLDIVADDAAAPTRRRHRAGVGIGQGDLAVRRRFDLSLHDLQHRHLGAKAIDLLDQSPGPRLHAIPLVPIGRV